MNVNINDEMEKLLDEYQRASQREYQATQAMQAQAMQAMQREYTTEVYIEPLTQRKIFLISTPVTMPADGHAVLILSCEGDTTREFVFSEAAKSVTIYETYPGGVSHTLAGKMALLDLAFGEAGADAMRFMSVPDVGVLAVGPATLMHQAHQVAAFGHLQLSGVARIYQFNRNV
jgi:hypothetical protein